MPPNDTDSAEYRAKKQFFQRMLTVYGRKPVLEALQDPQIKPFRLHLAESNKPAPIIRDIESAAAKKGAEIRHHSRDALARISKNARQDQGVALDVECRGFGTAEEFLASPPEHYEVLALDRVTNPQNLGMIIRSVCASPMTALLLPEKGSAKLDSLVIKASAGTLFKARILRCSSLPQCLGQFQQQGGEVVGLDAGGNTSLQDLKGSGRRIFVMGNETDGISPEVSKLCDRTLSIPMRNGVESLNVSIAASLIAFRTLL